MVVDFRADLEKLVASSISSLGFELIGLEFDNHSNPKVLRVYADVPASKVSDVSGEVVQNGITVDDCSKISYHLNKILSVEPALQQPSNYLLEVSSPGLERRLFNMLQMERHVGKEVKLHLGVALNNRSNFVGVLLSVDHALNRVLIEVDGQNLYFDFGNIAKANLVYRKF